MQDATNHVILEIELSESQLPLSQVKYTGVQCQKSPGPQCSWR